MISRDITGYNDTSIATFTSSGLVTTNARVGTIRP